MYFDIIEAEGDFEAVTGLLNETAQHLFECESSTITRMKDMKSFHNFRFNGIMFYRI